MKRFLLALLPCVLLACPQPVKPLEVELKATQNGLSVLLTATGTKPLEKVEFFEGSTLLGEDTTSPYTLEQSYLAAQAGIKRYSAKASANQQVVTSKTLEVTVTAPIDSTPPTIGLSATPNTRITVGDVELNATASDNVGVTKVEFFRGTILIATDTTAPYSQTLALTAAENGTHSYTAKAFDAAGNNTTSSAATVTINIPATGDTTPPTVGLSSSATSITTASPITLTATAADNVGVAKVEFFDGSSKLNEDFAAPFALELGLTAADNGTRNYTAKAFDAAGNNTTSSVVSVTVNISSGGDTQAPTVALSANSLSFNAAANLTLTANAADNIGVSKVEFFDGSTKLNEDFAAPFVLEIALTRASNGTRTYTAKAFDAAGNNTTSSAAIVLVNIPDTTPPSISLAASANPVIAAGNVTLTATASDDEGVVKVEFFEGSSKLGETLSAPFTLTQTYNQTMNGTKALTAKAFDAAGNSTVSSLLNLQIDIDTTPPVVSNLRANPTSIRTNTDYSLTFTVDVSDPSGVRYVEISMMFDNVTIGNSICVFYELPPPYSCTVTADGIFSYNPESYSGTYRFTARATDNRSNSSDYSPPLLVDITRDSIPPSVSVSSSLDANQQFVLNVAATDPPSVSSAYPYASGIAKVQILENNQVVAEISTPAPYTWKPNFSPNGSPAGTNTYSARAFDNLGNSTLSSSIQAFVAPSMMFRGIATDSSDNVYYAGFVQRLQNDPNSRDMVIQKRDNTGAIIWTKMFGDPNAMDEANDLARLANGRLAVVGFTRGKTCITPNVPGTNNAGGTDAVAYVLDANGNLTDECYRLQTNTDDFYNTVAALGNNFAAGGTTGVNGTSWNSCDSNFNPNPNLAGSNSVNAFVNFISTVVTESCAEIFGSPANDTLTDIAATANGQMLFLVGSTSGVMDGLRPNGTANTVSGGGWMRRFDVTPKDFAYTLQDNTYQPQYNAVATYTSPNSTTVAVVGKANSGGRADMFLADGSPSTPIDFQGFYFHRDFTAVAFTPNGHLRIGTNISGTEIAEVSMVPCTIQSTLVCEIFGRRSTNGRYVRALAVDSNNYTWYVSRMELLGGLVYPEIARFLY